MSKRSAMMAAVRQQGSVGVEPNLWTPAEIPMEVYLDHKDASTMDINGSNQITQWRDKSGNGNHMNPTGTLPTFTGSAGGVVCTVGTKLGTTASFAMDAFIVVMQYKDGIDTTADEHTFIYETISFQRIYLVNGTASWAQTSVSTGAAFVNGAAGSTTTALPMPKSLQRFAFTGYTGIVRMFQQSGQNRAVEGALWDVLIPKLGTSAANIEKLEGWAAWNSGTQATLAPGHFYKDAAPTL